MKPDAPLTWHSGLLSFAISHSAIHLIGECIAIDHIITTDVASTGVPLPSTPAFIMISSRKIGIVITPATSRAEKRTIVEGAILVKRITDTRLRTRSGHPFVDADTAGSQTTPVTADHLVLVISRQVVAFTVV